MFNIFVSRNYKPVLASNSMRDGIPKFEGEDRRIPGAFSHF